MDLDRRKRRRISWDDVKEEPVEFVGSVAESSGTSDLQGSLPMSAVEGHPNMTLNMDFDRRKRRRISWDDVKEEPVEFVGSVAESSGTFPMSAVEGHPNMTLHMAFDRRKRRRISWDDVKEEPVEFVGSVAESSGTFPMSAVEGHPNTMPSVTIANVVKDHVLPYFPAKSICRFRAVCKEWKQWLTSPFLAHKQTLFHRDVCGVFAQFPGTFSPSLQFVTRCRDVYGIPDPGLGFLPEDVEIKSSCNGLICCQSPEPTNKYYICNPAMEYWEVLPDPIHYHGKESSALLAFEPKTLNFRSRYSLVCAIPLMDTDLIQFEIFSSISMSWRGLESICDELKGPRLTGTGLFLKGIVFWEVVVNTEPETRYALSLDTFDEQYGIIKLPDAAGSNGALAEIFGELCYIMPNYNSSDILIYGGWDMRLKRRVGLQLGTLWRPLASFRVLSCFDDGDAILLLMGTNVVCYHLSTRKLEFLLSDTMLRSESKYFTYVNSLVEIPLVPLRDL